MDVKATNLILESNVFSEGAKLVRAQPVQGARQCDFLRLRSIWRDMEVLKLQLLVFRVSGLKDVSNSIYHCSLARVVFTYERSHSPVEQDIQSKLCVTKLPEILDVQS